MAHSTWCHKYQQRTAGVYSNRRFCNGNDISRSGCHVFFSGRKQSLKVVENAFSAGFIRRKALWFERMERLPPLAVVAVAVGPGRSWTCPGRAGSGAGKAVARQCRQMAADSANGSEKSTQGTYVPKPPYCFREADRSAARAGLRRRRSDATGATSGSCLIKRTTAPIQSHTTLEKHGLVIYDFTTLIFLAPGSVPFEPVEVENIVLGDFLHAIVSKH